MSINIDGVVRDKWIYTLRVFVRQMYVYIQIHAYMKSEIWYSMSSQRAPAMLHTKIVHLLTHWPLGDFNKILEK